MKIELDINPEELDKLADALAVKVAEKLKPLLSQRGHEDDRIFTIETLASYLSVEKEWVYAHVKKIPHYKVGRFPRFRKKDVDRWLEHSKAPIYNHLQHDSRSR